MSNILPIHTSLFQGHCIKVYGTNQEPLFNCLDVAKVLGYQKSNQDWFYKQNKRNAEYIVTLINNQALENSCDESVLNIRPSNSVKFFTEIGLYKCLKKSDKPIADEFHQFIKQVIDLNRRNSETAALKQLIQEQNQQIQQYSSFISKLNEYKDMLSIQYFIFQECTIRINGTKEDPLFNCLDVAKVLGYTKANQNWFYQQNKQNAEYIVRVSITDPVTPSNYFTETGLYECLFASDKPIAKQFRKEIVQLLKNIRLGIIGLHILDEQQYNKQLEENKNTIQLYRQQLQDLTDQVDSLQEDNTQKQQLLQSITKTCTLYKEKVLNDQGQVESEYAGSTTQAPHQRDRQHRSNSCNRHLREALDNGKTVEFEIVGQFQYIDENDRKHKERELILSIQKSKRLNIQNPRPSSIVRQPEEEKQQPQQQQSIQIQNVKKRERLSFDIQLNALKQFIDSTGKYPQKRSQDEHEAKLGRFVDTIRQQLNHADFKQPISDTNRQLLWQIIPDFIADEKEHNFRSNIVELSNYLKENKNIYPSMSKGDSGSQKNRLAKFIQHLQESKKNPVFGSIALNDSRLEYIHTMIPDFNWNEDPFYELRLQMEEIEQFYAEYGRLPRSNKSHQGDVPDKELKLGYRVWNLLNSLRGHTVSNSTAKAKSDFIQQHFPDVYSLIQSRIQ